MLVFDGEGGLGAGEGGVCEWGRGVVRGVGVLLREEGGGVWDLERGSEWKVVEGRDRELDVGNLHTPPSIKAVILGTLFANIHPSFR